MALVHERQVELEQVGDVDLGERVVRTGVPVPADLPFAVSELADAVWTLAGAYEDTDRAWDARDLASRAAARATRLHAGADLTLAEILAQVRSTAVDLMRAAELVAGNPEEQPTEELLPSLAAA